MTSARDEILANIRRSLGVTGREAPRIAAVDERIERAPRGVVPKRGQLPPEERVTLFKAMAEAAQATVEAVPSAADVPAAVAAYLRRHNLPATLRRGADARLAAMPWGETALEISVGPSDGHDLNGVSHAFAGVAESGTLVLVSCEDNPTTLNFLPDNHIVVVSAKDVIGDYEEVWSRVRFKEGKGLMPRTVNMITGPSRSGDIEQVLLLGAHGPRRLHIVVVDE
ncbi:lactate utilization protein [Chelatococcus sp. SYSU_G07232]|uniref:Lactate utilization protein n=1 Tax=Chelatococcus albus TaxID=3047466 RepID=A0ABT7AEX1_9HYPH|nr:lactate utilization protein [Chelatococcus sp. SYSU_G07232]MDJ1157922.1 lactate utilization protein [Chelatococcus sp. SYSU_G07232]